MAGTKRKVQDNGDGGSAKEEAKKTVSSLLVVAPDPPVLTAFAADAQA